MAITRTLGSLIGTTEGTGVTIANNASAYSGGGVSAAAVDLLGDGTSVGDAWFYLVVTTSANQGSFDVYLIPMRVSGQPYTKAQADFSIPPGGANIFAPLGKRPISRYFGAQVLNNGTGANGTNVGLLFELEKFT